MSLSDLENDFLNPFDVCNRLNRFVVRRRAVDWARTDETAAQLHTPRPLEPGALAHA